MKSKLIKLILSLMMVSLYSFITPIKGNIVGKDEIQKRNKIQKVIMIYNHALNQMEV